MYKRPDCGSFKITFLKLFCIVLELNNWDNYNGITLNNKWQLHSITGQETINIFKWPPGIRDPWESQIPCVQDA